MRDEWCGSALQEYCSRLTSDLQAPRKAGAWQGTAYVAPWQSFLKDTTNEQNMLLVPDHGEE